MVWMVAKWSIYVRFVSVKRRIDTIRWEGKLIDEIYLKTHSKSSFSFLGISFRSLETILWIAHCVHNVNGHSLKTSCISGIIVEAKKKNPSVSPLCADCLQGMALFIVHHFSRRTPALVVSMVALDVSSGYRQRLPFILFLAKSVASWFERPDRQL